MHARTSPIRSAPHRAANSLAARLALGLWLGLWLGLIAACGGPKPPAPKGDQITDVRSYIRSGWKTLSRSHSNLLAAAKDPKFPATGKWFVYVAATEDLAAVTKKLQSEIPAAEWAQLEVRVLPKDVSQMREHGILYLPYPYVVPGGRFNEMYGWDSYFIVLGLLQDGETELAKNMVDNFVYQIKHYGTILNANRSYYLSRSQPPFLTQMIKDVYAKTGDAAWLREVVPAAITHYEFWTRAPRLAENGLSHYYDNGQGPAPEVVADEKDEQGRTHYDRIAAFYKETIAEKKTAALGYDLKRFFDEKTSTLTPLFYVADRAMRESGFDPSNRFGQFNIGALDYTPVCLNSLLYVMETDLGELVDATGLGQGQRFRDLAAKRKELVNSLLWDATAGLYFDYDLQSRGRRNYPFATTFFPLWAGIATPEIAERAHQSLSVFERTGGVVTSTVETGNQWDAPFGWAPLQLVAAKGLRRYGFSDSADRISKKFIALVEKEFTEHSAIFEKYDVVANESAVSAGIRFGYASNEIGFGWTNAAYLVLSSELTPAK